MSGSRAGAGWHLLNFVTFSFHLVDDIQHHGHSCALLGVFWKMSSRYSSGGCSGSEIQGSPPGLSVEPAQGSACCARLSEHALWVCVAGEQHIQSLCLQPGEGMSSGEELEQQPCEI